MIELSADESDSSTPTVRPRSDLRSWKKLFTPFLQAAAPFGQFNPHHAPEDASLKHRRDPRFPTPDRSDLPRNFVKTADNDTLDIGWDEGVLRDGRPDVVEARCQDQVAMLTFFWSTDGMENATSEELGRTLVDEGVLRLAPEKHYVAARRFVDPSHHDLWSVNVVVGDDEDRYVVADTLQLRPYR